MTEHQSSAERKAQIVTAMIETMAAHGYAKATIARIADTAGLTSGLLHYHFRDKQEILLGVLERLVDTQLDAVDAIVDGDQDPRQTLDALLVALLAPGDAARPAQVAAWVAVLAEAVRQPAVGERLAESLQAFRGRIETVIERGVERGDFHLGSVSSAAAAAGLIALVQGYYSVGVTARDVIPSGTAIGVARRMVAGLTRANE